MADTDSTQAYKDLIGLLGADPRMLALINQLTPRDLQDPMAVAEKIGGQPGFYQGSKLGAYIYPPGPIRQSNPVQAILGALAAKRSNEMERRRLERVAGGLALPQLGGGGGGRTDAAPLGAPTSPNKSASDLLDAAYRARTTGGR